MSKVQSITYCLGLLELCFLEQPHMYKMVYMSYSNKKQVGLILQLFISMLSKPRSLPTYTSYPAYGWVCPIPLGELMTSSFLHIKLVGLDLETRSRQQYPRSLVHFRMEGGPFKGDRCDIHFDFLDFTSQRV